MFVEGVGNERKVGAAHVSSTATGGTSSSGRESVDGWVKMRSFPTRQLLGGAVQQHVTYRVLVGSRPSAA